MKKSLSFLLVLLFAVTLAVPALAANEAPESAQTDTMTYEVQPQAGNSDGMPADAVTHAPGEAAVDESVYEEMPADTDDVPRLADGLPGRGGIDDIEKYWAQNGYPENVSFAYEAGGEMLPDGTVVSWWEIGVVDTDEAGKQAILDLLSPSCRVTFWDRQVTYREREAAYNEILARSKEDANIQGVVMVRNSEGVMVQIAEGVEKEYAGAFVREFGSFVGVTNDLNAVQYTLAGGGLDTGAREAGMGAGGFWFWPLCLLVALGLATVLFMNRARLVPALQTTNGTVVTRGAPLSAKETVQAVKNSEAIPDDKVFDAIMDRIGK